MSLRLRSKPRQVATRPLAAALVCSLAAAPALAAPKAGGRPPAAAPAPVKATESTASTGTLTIASMTRGAEVYVDDALQGEVPLAGPLVLSAGVTHTIRVQKRGFAPLVETVLLSAGQSQELEADLVPTGGILRVTSNVVRAQVLLSGQTLGRTPFDGDVPPGAHTLQVAASGYQPFQQAVVIRAGEAHEVSATLTAVQTPAPVKDQRLVGKWWFWTALGVAVVGGVTAGVLLSQDSAVAPPAPNGVLKL